MMPLIKREKFLGFFFRILLREWFSGGGQDAISVKDETKDVLWHDEYYGMLLGLGV